MTDKERLEEIKLKFNNTIDTMLYVPYEDVKFLIEQAERAEYYEIQNEQKKYAFEEIIRLLNEDYFENWEQAIEVAYDNKNDFVRSEKLSSDLKIRTTKEQLEQQNKRYREAIERALDESGWGDEGNALHKMIIILAKALEESE